MNDNSRKLQRASFRDMMSSRNCVEVFVAHCRGSRRANSFPHAVLSPNKFCINSMNLHCWKCYYVFGVTAAVLQQH